MMFHCQTKRDETESILPALQHCQGASLHRALVILNRYKNRRYIDNRSTMNQPSINDDLTTPRTPDWAYAAMLPHHVTLRLARILPSCFGIVHFASTPRIKINFPRVTAGGAGHIRAWYNKYRLV